MHSVPAGAPPGDSPDASWRLWVALRLEPEGAEVAREPVLPGDLSDVIAEMWREDVLRQGRADVTLEDFAVHALPDWSPERQTYIGYTLAGRYPPGNVSERQFSVRSLEPVAARAAERLIAQGRLQPHDAYWFVLDAAQCAPDKGGLAGIDQTAMRTRPLVPLQAEIGPLLRRAKPVGPVVEEGGPFTVFYTEAVLAHASRCSRLGVHQYPPVETGGLLAGFLCACPVSGEFYAVVVEVLEALDADQSQFSLAYSSQTWARIQTVMDARQQHDRTRGMRILGQCHGHNFIPGDGAPPCELCDKVAVCTRSSVFVSRDDWDWNRAVFHRQPWQLCHIFGFNARHEEVHGLFGLRDGRLLERGFHVLPDFELENRQP